MKAEHRRKESCGEVAEADVLVDSDSRTKLEQLVKSLQNEVTVMQRCSVLFVS